MKKTELQKMYANENDPTCPKCGSDMHWQDCWDCEEGLSYHDCGEDICCCLNPTNNVTCDICNGKGGWLVCEVCIALEQKKQREGIQVNTN
jgi:hypothetical protein